MLGERRRDVATLIAQEQGKPIQEAMDEVALTIGLMESFARAGYRLGQQFQPLAVEARIGNRFGFTRQRPIGITALLTPNTFPLLIPAQLLLASLAAGDSVLLKPASATPLSALRLLDILAEAGVAMSSVSCLTGPGEITGQAICRHPLIDQIHSQSGTETLRAIRSEMGPVPLRYHHGGSGACVVAADADLNRAVEEIVRQRFENAGQTALSASMVFVDSAVVDELVERLRLAMLRFPTGDPLLPGTRIGPLTERSRVTASVSLIGGLIASGARLVAGGPCEGSMLAPVLLADVPARHPALWTGNGYREVLAPIIMVTPVNGPLEEVASWVDRRTQLVVSVFSKDLDRATRFASLLPIFNVHVNGIPTWRDGAIFTSDSLRLGRRQVDVRVKEVSILQDIVFHPG
jgi:glyceraldehyde-3-phosphate dehydrogenase (NADP+)